MLRRRAGTRNSSPRRLIVVARTSYTLDRVPPPSAPLVSVCIRAFDRPDTLHEAIASVLAQTFRDFELVVSDDSGRLEPVVLGFADARVRYHRNPRPAGSVANIRTALGLARGSLLALLDDDDQWLPGFLATVVDRFERDPGAGIVFTNRFLDVAGRRVPLAPVFAEGGHSDLLATILAHPLPTPCTTVQRREVWLQGERDCPLVDGVVGDQTMWLRAAAHGWRFHYVDEPLAVYRLHRGQMTWSDPGLAARSVATFERFSFEGPSERLRRARLAEARLAQANADLRRRRYRSAWRGIGQARREAPERLGLRAALALTGVRGPLTRWVYDHPRLLPGLIAAWRRVRPPVVRRAGA